MINMHVQAKQFMLPANAADLQKGFIFKFLLLIYFYFPQIFTFAVKHSIGHFRNILKFRAKYFNKVIHFPICETVLNILFPGTLIIFKNYLF